MRILRVAQHLYPDTKGRRTVSRPRDESRLGVDELRRDGAGGADRYVCLCALNIDGNASTVGWIVILETSKI